MLTVKLYLKQWDATFTFVHVRKQEQVFQRRRPREYSRNGIRWIKSRIFAEQRIKSCWDIDSNWWETLKGDESVKIHVRNNFPYKLPLTQESLIANKREDELFGYVQFNLEIPDGLKQKFSKFSPIFKNINGSRADIGDYLRDYAIDNDLLKQTQRMLISSFKLENLKVITPLLNFYFSPGLKCIKI